MASHEATHAALARTVDELVQWLGVVEVGLSAVLERTLPTTGNGGGGSSSGMATNGLVAGPHETFLELEQSGDGGPPDLPSAKSDLTFSAEDDLAEEELGEPSGGNNAGTFEHFLAKVRKHEQELGGEDGWLADDALEQPRPSTGSSSSTNGFTPDKDKFSFSFPHNHSPSSSHSHSPHSNSHHRHLDAVHVT